MKRGDIQRRYSLSDSMSGMLATAASDMPCDDGNHHSSQDAASHDLEQHVRQAVGGVVGVAEAGIPDRLGEDNRSTEADESRRESQARDTGSDGTQTGSHARSFVGTGAGRPS